MQMLLMCEVIVHKLLCDYQTLAVLLPYLVLTEAVLVLWSSAMYALTSQMKEECCTALRDVACSSELLWTVPRTRRHACAAAI